MHVMHSKINYEFRRGGGAMKLYEKFLDSSIYFIFCNCVDRNST